MLGSLLVGLLLVLGQKPVQTGVIAGMVKPPEQQKFSRPVQVVLLTPKYENFWDSDLQQRLDVYWERYKPEFAIRKEFFYEVSRMAQREAINNIIARMRRDFSGNIADYVQETTPDGKFEFKHVPFGPYKILALGKIGDQDVIWQDSIDVQTPIPQILELKKRVP
ncbi:MAG TPA: hypothetical protein VE422_14685 [Terriglobia bacterium]|nr:hypothetical protein [Terriglobia bacterium]